jgi:2-polyprenyl-6-methoxyphenol hydroxylase-like FAD-dependent oxidoreductase
MLLSDVASTNIVICGAGVAGLTLAIRSAQLGRKSIVLEARSESAVSTEGVFLTLAPNGMNGLKAIDCFAEVKAAGIVTTGIELRNARGKRLACVEQSDHEREFGAPSVTLGRGQLLAILVAHARSAGVDVRFDARLMEANEQRGKIALRLSTGESVEADILVAADGLRSTVREKLFPEYPGARFTGLIGTGGTAEASIADTGGVMRMTFGDSAFFGYIKVDARPLYWFNSYGANEPGDGKVEDPEAYAEAIFAMHANDPEPNGTILRRAGRLERNYPPKLPSWHRGRVVLVGDAAHAVGPHAGQGASMAIEDALVLAACMEEERDCEHAFSRYESLRSKRIEKVVELTRANSAPKRLGNKLAILVRDLLLPFLIPLGIRAGRKLFRFRADLTPLAPPG